MVPVHMSHLNENDPQTAIRGTGLTVRHGAVVALDDATFAFPGGRTTAIIGPNGSGKSTLLHAVAGLHEPDGGSIEVGAAVAYVPQHLHANGQLPISVREVVTMGRYAHRGPWGRLRPEDRAAVDRAMERLRVATLSRRQLGELSGGERQRVLVAQALAQEATVLLLDEPLTGLDLPSQERILEVVDEERDAGHTVVASTHSLHDASTADHLLLLAEGRVVAQGPPGRVLTEANLTEAYGEMVVKFGDDRTVLLDDTPHHHLN
jgi:ABC-type Mn2+/Zn2+ transport system ATPase subunit